MAGQMLGGVAQAEGGVFGDLGAGGADFGSVVARGAISSAVGQGMDVAVGV